MEHFNKIVHRSVVIVSIVLVPCIFVLVFGNHLLLAVQLNAQVVEHAALFTRLSIIGVCAGVFAAITHKICESFGSIMPVLFSCIIGLIVDLMCNIILVAHFKLGLYGIAISFVISRFSILLFALLSLYAFDLHLWYTRLEWSEIFKWQPIWEYSKLGIAGGVLNVMDMGIIEMQSVVVLYFGVVQMNAFTTMKHITSLVTTACKSIGIGYSIRIGHRLGDKSAYNARAVFLIGLIIVSVIAVACALTMIILRSIVGYVGTSDTLVVKLASSLAVYFAFVMLLECIKMYCSASLRALGKQWIGMVCTLLSMYCVAIPCMALFVFYAQWKAFGIVSGYFIGLVALCCAVSVIFVRLDWQDECQRAYERVHHH